MVLITTGTLNFPFTRLLDCCLTYFYPKTGTKIVMQNPVYKPVSLPPHITHRALIPRKEMLILYTQAKLVISAAGEGSLLEMLALTPNKPLLFPRDPKHQEHVDKQQIEIAQEMKQREWCDVALNCSQLRKYLVNFELQAPIKNKLQGRQSHPPSALLKFLHTITKL